MYFSLETGIQLDEKTKHLSNARFDAYWEGFAFVKGKKPGEYSVRSFLADLEIFSIEEVCKKLSGAFAMVVRDKKDEIWFVFTDNGRQKPLFYSDNGFSTSFLRIAKERNLKFSDMASSCIVEFIVTGFQFGNKTYFDQISVLDAKEILKIIPGKQILKITKEDVDPFDKVSTKDPINVYLYQMEKISESLRNLNVSVDLTGGTDSRTTAAILDYFGLDFEVAVSGTQYHPDIVISSRVVDKFINKHDYYPFFHETSPDKLWSRIVNQVKLLDGLGNAVGGMDRIYQLSTNRKSRDIDLVIGSGGGELYKDGGWWRTAFILSLLQKHSEQELTKRLVDSGLVNWGIGRELPVNIFIGDFRQICQDYKASVYKTIQGAYSGQDKNTYLMADRIFYEYSMRAPRDFSCRIIDKYIPLLDPELVAIGVHLPLRLRLAHRFYRNILSRVNPEIAEIPTSRAGLSLSKGFWSVFRDLHGLIGCFLSDNRTVNKEQASLYPTLRSLQQTRQALRFFQEREIINSGLSVKELSDVNLGRIVSLYVVAQEFLV